MHRITQKKLNLKYNFLFYIIIKADVQLGSFSGVSSQLVPVTWCGFPPGRSSVPSGSGYAGAPVG